MGLVTVAYLYEVANLRVMVAWSDILLCSSKCICLYYRPCKRFLQVQGEAWCRTDRWM